ncbi:MAG: replicative DNA helicase [Oscillospiraceae bacterium]|nr:replicative DNA helicase [Oscillospiraceae bacterium]
MADNYHPLPEDSAGLPYSLEAEQAVLGSILVDPDCLTLIQSEGFQADYFYLPQHRLIYGSILQLQTTGGVIDPLLVVEKLRESDSFDDASGKQYIAQLVDMVPSTANVESYAKIIQDKFYKRALITASREILEQSEGESADAETLLDSAEQKIYDIRQGRSNSDASQLGDIVMDKVYETLGQLNSEDREKYLGIKTGYSDLDKTISGLNKSDLIIVGARPAMGKTSFALNIARNVAVHGKKVLFFSLEMTKEQLASRVISMEARIQGLKMRTGLLTDEDWLNLSIASTALRDVPLYFDDTSNISVNEMKAKIMRMKDVDCVFIDYLQLMKSPNRTESRVQEVSEITRNLKLMAKDLEIPVVVLAQLARGTEARGKSHRPQLSDLRESGSIEQDADIVLMLYRDDYYSDTSEEEEDVEEKEIDKVEVIVAKNRHGPTNTVELGWNGEFTLFTSLEHHRDDDLF